MSGASLTHLYLSPHLDDAVLSCGGMIHCQAQAGEQVVVVTVCASRGTLSAFAQALHARWETPTNATAARRAEDLAALHILGAEGLHLAVPDCIYRTDPASGEHLYISEAGLFGDLHPSESILVQQTAVNLSALLEPLGPGRLYAPFGLGHHVDHQLTRQAAERLGGVYAYYEDYPYAEREAVQATSTLSPEIIPLSETDLAAKVRAISAYVSQLSSFWKDEAGMAAAVRQFAEGAGGGWPGGRLWRPA